MELLIKIKDVPENSTVTKKTGTQKFIVKEKINIYTYDTTGSSNKEKKVMTESGFKYMIDTNGNINMVTDDTVVKLSLLQDGYLDTDLLERIIGQVTGCDYVNITAENSK